MKQWQLKSQEVLLKTVPFSVEALHVQSKNNKEAVFHRLLMPDWINVVALTPNYEAVLIRQSRVGILSDTLETPGGCVEPHEKDTTMTAARELEEETGYTSHRILPVAKLPTNPAISNNYVHLFLALNCHLNPNRQHFPDHHEEIQVELFPFRDLDEMIRLGQVSNPYSALNIALCAKFLKSALKL